MVLRNVFSGNYGFLRPWGQEPQLYIYIYIYIPESRLSIFSHGCQLSSLMGVSRSASLPDHGVIPEAAAPDVPQQPQARSSTFFRRVDGTKVFADFKEGKDVTLQALSAGKMLLHPVACVF